MDGSLHPANILMCPHTCVTNLPQPRQKHPGKKTMCPLLKEMQRLACEWFKQWSEFSGLNFDVAP